MSKHKYLNRILLTQRPTKALAMDAEMFAQSVGLAGLAIDLARLEWQRDKTSKRPPSDYLAAATGLVNEASLHTGTHADEVRAAIEEKRIREREVEKVTWVTWATFFDATSEPHLVTLKDGGKFLWNPIGSDKQRRAFLKKHFDRVGIEDAERPGIEQRWREAGVSPEMVRQLAVTRMGRNKLKGVKIPKAAEPVEGT